MKEWCDAVIEMSDCEPHNSKHIKKICNHIFRYICITKIKDIKKFKEKYGTDYELFIQSLSEYPSEIINDILDYDGFWEKTHEFCKKYKSKTNPSKD